MFLLLVLSARAFFCLRDVQTQTPRDVIEYDLYTVNNMTTRLVFNPCGPLADHPETNVVLRNDYLDQPLTDIATEQLTSSNSTLVLSYTLADAIPDCPTYAFTVEYECLPTAAAPQVVHFRYTPGDVFFCSNTLSARRASPAAG